MKDLIACPGRSFGLTAALPGAAPRPIEVSAPEGNGKAAGRRLVVVLGMHRCGTSLLANFLNTLGVDLGRDLMEPDRWNADGYWELQGLREVGDEILARLDRSFLSSKGVLPFADGWWRLESLQPLKQRLKDILLSQMDESSPLWGFKDPRTASLLPLWREIFDELGLEPIYLLAIRHPQAVASSMVRRNRITSFHAQMLYVMTNLDAVRHTDGQIRAIVDYDRWFTHPEEQARIVLAALEMADRFTPEQIAAATAQVVKENLRHHCASKDDGLLPQALQVYQMLQRASCEGTLPAELWEIEQEFRQTQRLLASWADAGMLPAAQPSVYTTAAKVLESAPAMLSASERCLLYALTLAIRPRRALEIGTMHGGSAQIMVAALDAVGEGRLVCLYPKPNLKVDWNTIAHRATLLQEGSPEAVARAREVAGGPFDLCFIDGWHVYGQVLVDACAVLEHMAPNGYILFHDAYLPRVREAIDDFVRSNPVVDCGIVSRQYNTAAPNGPWAGLRLVRVAKASDDAPVAPLQWTSRVSAEQEHKLVYAENMIQEGRLAEARKALNSILMTEQPAEALNDYAVIEILQGRAASAQLLLQKVLEIIPAYQPAVDNLQYLAQRTRPSAIEG